jgi:hypothetical protein
LPVLELEPGGLGHGREEIFADHEVVLDDSPLDAVTLLERMLRIGLGPRDDQWDTQAAFETRALLAAERLVERPIAAVVGEEDDQRLLGNPEFVEALEQVTQRLIHALHHGGEGKRLAL